MTNPTRTMLPLADCELGYPEAQFKAILADNGRSLYDFNKWMEGQTMAICEGRLYDHDTKTYKPCCGGTAHGVVVYGHDLARFLDRRPIVDW